MMQNYPLPPPPTASEQPKGNGRGEESKEKKKNQAKNMTLKLQNNQTIRKTARGKKSKDVHRLEVRFAMKWPP